MVAILGISAFYHDSGAALLIDGEIVAACQEERFSRVKNDASFPREAINYCLDHASLSLSDIDRVVFYEKPFLKFERLLDSQIAFAPIGVRAFARAMPVWVKEKLFQKSTLLEQFRDMDPAFADRSKLSFGEHHLSHLASAYYPSPFDKALILSIDGVGERTTTAVAIGKGREIEIVKEIQFPHSLGLLYSTFTEYLGFRVNYDEYKVMGLAPYGAPKFRQEIYDKLIEVREDGSFWMDQSYFGYAHSLHSINRRFCNLFGQPARLPEEPLTQFHMDVARSIQVVTEEIVLKIAVSMAREFGQTKLCLAGGVAQNSVANGLLVRSGVFDEVWVQPAAGDAGGSLGAVLAYWHLAMEQPRAQTNRGDTMKGAALGPGFNQQEIEVRLRAIGVGFAVLSDKRLFQETAEAIASGKVVGWFDGRLEYGPRALGNRSILGDPRSESMQAKVNLQIKGRENFRPFAPAVLAEYCKDWFELRQPSPYMGIVAHVNQDKLETLSTENQILTGMDRLKVRRSSIPAVTHVDGSARIQTVSADQRPRFYALIEEFHALTGCPMLLNTSFNARDEPLVCTPEDAYRTFILTGMDMLVCGNCVVTAGPIANSNSA